PSIETGPPAGLHATIFVPMAAAARAASPIFHVMLSVVLGLMTLIRMRRLPERFELGPDSSRALLIFVGRSRLIAARVAVAPLPIHRGGFAYAPAARARGQADDPGHLGLRPGG